MTATTITFKYQPGDIVTIKGGIPGVVNSCMLKDRAFYEVQYFDIHTNLKYEWLDESWLTERKRT